MAPAGCRQIRMRIRDRLRSFDRRGGARVARRPGRMSVNCKVANTFVQAGLWKHITRPTGTPLMAASNAALTLRGSRHLKAPGGRTAYNVPATNSRAPHG